MIKKFSVHRHEYSAPTHLTALLPGLRVSRDYYIEFADEPAPKVVTSIGQALIDPLVEYVVQDEPFDPGNKEQSDPGNKEQGDPGSKGRVVQVAYKRGIVDNENDSLVILCRLLGAEVIAAKVATAYRCEHPALATVIQAQACNSNIEELHTEEPGYESLLPVGQYAPAERYDLRSLADDELTALGSANGRSLELDKMRKIQHLAHELGLNSVTDVLLEALDARWSDHCAHTTWASLGNLLHKLIDASQATKNPNIVSMFHDNAGIWDFYGGYGIAIKAETHNGPSAVSAYFGQLTKVGGVLRDILGTGLGADPIGVFEYTATGLPNSPAPIAGRPTSKQIANETIRAVKEYGNTFGVPMMWSQMTFHDKYRAKPFALGGSIGLIPIGRAHRGQAQPADHVMLIGGLTGNDGIHGASGSSAGSIMDQASVQIGSPLEEIKFREAILELRDSDCLRAVTDLGAAGLNSAVGEMGEGVGVWLNTALVPLKTGGLPMWRILVSESQERMLLAVSPERLRQTQHILDRHVVRHTVVGRFTGNDRYCVVHDEQLTEKHVIEMEVTQGVSGRSIPELVAGRSIPELGAAGRAAEVGFDIPYDKLGYRPPARVVQPPPAVTPIPSQWPLLSPVELADLMHRVVADSEVCSQWYAACQYDSSVLGRTYYGPQIGETIGGAKTETGETIGVASRYWANRPIYGKPHAAVLTTAFNPWLFEAHPVLAARQCFLSALTAQVLAGVDITDVCWCDNFYTPHLEPGAQNWLVAMVEELAALARRFRTPFISGKDSSAGSTHTDEGVVSVPPAVFLSALGKVPDAATLRPEAWQQAGNLLVLVGLRTPSLAGTVAARVLDRSANDVDEVSLNDAVQFLNALHDVPPDVAPSGRVIRDGGVITTLMLGALAGGLGAELSITPGSGAGSGDVHELLYEHRVAAVLEVPPAALPNLAPELQPTVLGRITTDKHRLTLDGVDLLTDSIIDIWQATLEGKLS